MVTITKQFPPGTIQLKAGETYGLPHGYEAGGRKFVKIGAGKNPVLQYSGADATAGLHVGFETVCNLDNVDFLICPAAYAFNLEGALVLNNSVVRGGGGKCKAAGASGISVWNNWWTEGWLDKYDVFLGGNITENDYRAPKGSNPGSGGTKFKMRNTQEVRMTECGNRRSPSDPKGKLGSEHESIFRGHAIELLSQKKCSWNNPDGPKAAGRYHDGGYFKIEETSLDGNDDLGPMAEKGGSENLLPGPMREYYDKLTLARLDFKKVVFKSRFIKINPGILAGDWDEITASATSAGALFVTEPHYMNRLLSVIHIKNKSRLSYKDSKGGRGRLFSDERGAARFKVDDGVTFNDNTVIWPKS